VTDLVFTQMNRRLLMTTSGYHWVLHPEGDCWRWKAVGRDDQTVFAEGEARTRAEAAACLVRAMSLGVLNGQGRLGV
jgi:hypothetical protein